MLCEVAYVRFKRQLCCSASCCAHTPGYEEDDHPVGDGVEGHRDGPTNSDWLWLRIRLDRVRGKYRARPSIRRLKAMNSTTLSAHTAMPMPTWPAGACRISIHVDEAVQ